MDLSIKNLQNVDQTKGNVLTNATKHKETVVHKRFRQIFVFGCKKTDNNKKEEAKKRTDKKELKKTFFVEIACTLLFPCVSSHW